MEGLFLILFSFSLLFLTVSADIGDKLSYYEIITTPETIGRYRRSIYTDEQHDDNEQLIKEITLTAFNRSFHLILKPRTEIFSPNFKISVVHSDGSETIAALQEGNFYEGKVQDEEDSEVHGYFEDGSFTGTILLDGELYIIESAWRHIDDKNHGIGSGKMVAYRGSDMQWPDKGQDRHSYCQSARVDSNDEMSDTSTTESKPNSDTQKRKKRATPTKNTCTLFAVADYKFYVAMGRSDIYRTASYLVGVIERTDAIYRQTNWGGTQQLTGLGLELGLIRIHDAPTISTYHYNQAKNDWATGDFLDAFGRDETLQNYCVGHLFTHQSFTNNVLGLAYISPARTSGLGGICSPSQTSGGIVRSYNTGWTTTKNTGGDTVLTQQADLVTAHEIGHNWGSEHDSDTGNCAPSSIFGDGKYLMYPFSVTGYDSNNFKFSDCSKVSVQKVLAAKLDSCFKEPTPVTLCGNGKIDAGTDEECDAGFLGKYGQDKCCNSFCKLTATSECSPVNHECCLNCQRAPVGTVCRNDTFSSCKTISYCPGNSLDCPASLNADDDTSCIDSGVCRGGACLGICEGQGLQPCVCEEVSTSCLRCCRNSTHGVCNHLKPQTSLPHGRPCAQGYCVAGSCKKAAQSLVERLFNLIDNISLDAILIFFRDNIVGCVMIFTLILWIPISCGISYWDRKRERRFNNIMDIEPRTDRMFVYDEDKRRVKVPDQHVRPRTPKEIFIARSHKKY
ncbi:ADAM 17-like protease [Patella vulgata]|uniref:ADAM 17-like protease n=1 Tax=Patella vulgata TaxID=6465 RepID=UPI00217F4D96|nr:ADAM 17-like protease [Patella vulgata]